MVSNTTHEDDQIVIAKEASSNKSAVSNKSDTNEASSSNKSNVSKIEEQVKYAAQPNDDNVENEAENLLVIICDTCGDQGWQKYLVICETCKVGAEHTYCMAVKRKTIPSKWGCYDCIEDKGKSLIDPFEMSERTSSQREFDFLKTQSYNETVGMELNQDPIPDGVLDSIPDLNIIPDEKDSDWNQGPIPKMNPDPNPGLILSLGHASSSSYLPAKKPKSLSLTPCHEQHYPEEEEQDEDEVDKQHRAKRPRVDTTLSLF